MDRYANQWYRHANHTQGRSGANTEDKVSCYWILPHIHWVPPQVHPLTYMPVCQYASRAFCKSTDVQKCYPNDRRWPPPEDRYGDRCVSRYQTIVRTDPGCYASLGLAHEMFAMQPPSQETQRRMAHTGGPFLSPALSTGGVALLERASAASPVMILLVRASEHL